MDRKPNPKQLMCRLSCGFYGDPATDGLCSMCYKESLKKKQPLLVDSTAVSVPRPQPSPTQSPRITVPSRNEEKHNTSCETETQPAEDDKNKEANKDPEKKKRRCAECRKKVGLTDFPCRCGGLYCAIHRYSDKHNCTFDYRQYGAQEIRRKNPLIVAEKINKI